jgi:hypothetical protein
LDIKYLIKALAGKKSIYNSAYRVEVLPDSHTERLLQNYADIETTTVGNRKTQDPKYAFSKRSWANVSDQGPLIEWAGFTESLLKM